MQLINDLGSLTERDETDYTKCDRYVIGSEIAFAKRPSLSWLIKLISGCCSPQIDGSLRRRNDTHAYWGSNIIGDPAIGCGAVVDKKIFTKLRGSECVDEGVGPS